MIPSLVRVGSGPLDEAAHVAAVKRPDAGAVVSFAGVVRDNDRDRPVVELTYESHPDAEALLRAVAAEVSEMPGVLSLAVSHRVGTMQVGDVALVAAVSAAHRAEAFTACAALVDTVKERLPVWKRQLFADGSHEWVNCA